MNTQERAELEKMEELRKVIEASPLTQKIKEEKAAETLATRQEAGGKLEVLRKKQAKVIPKLREAMEDKEAKYLEVKVLLDAALGELQTARTTLSGENNSFDSDIRNQEAILYESADPRIDEAIQFFRDKFDELRKPGRISSRGMKVESNLFTDVKTLTTETNKAAVLEAIFYCQNSIKLLKRLKLSPEFHIEGIQELKDKLPSIEVYQEVSGESPAWPRINTDPLNLFKSDSQLDWEMGKLNEDFKKLMRK
ncbi:MAG: hypothetical protein ABSH06_00265 [Thermodesulfobacteriota bacterium]